MPSATEQAVKRLAAALQSLEFAIQQRLSETASADGLSGEVEMLTADRARLAESLDKAEARAVKLDGLNHDVSKRLAAAIETISDVIEMDRH